MNSLRIDFEGRAVGIATEESDSGRFALTYDPRWLDADDAFAASVNLPLREKTWPADRAHAFFANLLPEGIARDEICRQLGVSPDNDVALLRCTGRRHRGRVSIRAH